MKKEKGFTLIELVMVITILGILAVVAVPRFVDLRNKASEAAEYGIKAAIESGAKLWNAHYYIDSSGQYSTEYPAGTDGWKYCLDEDTTADIDAKYTIAYEATTGHATVTAK